MKKWEVKNSKKIAKNSQNVKNIKIHSYNSEFFDTNVKWFTQTYINITWLTWLAA